MKIIIGIAVINTSEMTYDNFFVSPLIAPAVAMAADTPQIETALLIIMVSSSSIFNLLQTQKAKYHTLKTTTNAWINPNPPAFKMSENITPVPNKTSPIFTNSSADNDSRIQVGSLKTLLTTSPMVRLKITDSRFRAFTWLFPDKINAINVSTNSSGKVLNAFLTDLLIRYTASKAIAKTKANCKAAFPKFSAENTL